MAAQLNSGRVLPRRRNKLTVLSPFPPYGRTVRTPLALLALLFAGCAQPAPLLPEPPKSAPVAAVPAEVTAPAPAPKPLAPEVRLVGEPKEPACATCWTPAEIFSALVAAGLLAWALAKLYRAKAGKDGR